MVTSNENMVNGSVARAELGKPGPPIGKSRYAAIRNKMGLTSRYVFVSHIRSWLAKHPNFSEREVYHRKPYKPVNRGQRCTQEGLQPPNGRKQHAQ